MNLEMTWGDLAKAVHGRLAAGSPEAPVPPICTDTRSLAPGQAFWALRGERLDAHDFLGAPAAQRAGGWVVGPRWRECASAPPPRSAGRTCSGSLRSALRAPSQVLEVGDTLAALQALAAHHRKRFDIPLGCLTGSNGKTTTKEMARSILSTVGPTCANAGNLNNHVGLPLSLLELGSQHRYAVFELGASRVGEIEKLARIAQPTVGALTNIAPAHIEFFGSMENVFKAKTELLGALGPEGRVAFNLDDPWLGKLSGPLGARGVPFGWHPSSRVRIAAHEGKKLTLILDRSALVAQLKVPGRLNAYNAACAAALAWAMGVPLDRIREGLEGFVGVALRFEPRPHASGSLFVVDAYNANPGSMRAAVESFLDSAPDGQRYLVLGDMKELGDGSLEYHAELGRWLAGLGGISGVYLAGADMSSAAKALAGLAPALPVKHGAHFRDWAGDLRASLGPGRTFFFKASRALEFEKLVEEL